MLPTEQFTDRKHQDLDSLLSQLNEPKEQIFSSQNPPPTQQHPGMEPVAQNLNNYQGDPEPVETLSPEVAALSGKTIAGTIDTVFGTGCSLYAKNKEPEKYQATPRQFEQLQNAWAAVAIKYGYKVEDSPWLNVGLLTTAVYLPKWQEAKNDRRFAEMDDKIDEMRKEVELLKAAKANLEPAPAK